MTVDCGLERYLCIFLGGKLKWENTFPVWVQGPMSESSGRWLGDLSSWLEFRCGGISISEKLLVPHLSPLQVSDLLTLGVELDHGRVNPFHSPFEFWDLLPKLNKPTAKKQDLSLSGWTCVIQPSFCKCQADIFISTNLAPCHSLNGICAPRRRDLLHQRLRGTPDPGFAAHSTGWWRRKHLLFPVHKYPSSDAYNTPRFSLFEPKVLI